MYPTRWVAKITIVRVFVLLFLTLSNASSNPLKGKELYCCTIHQFPNVFDDERVEPFKQDGMAVAVLRQLERQAGFKCRVLVEIDEPGVGFTEFIEEMRMCQMNVDSEKQICKCEMGVGGWMLTQKRFGLVDFLPVFVHDDVRVITHIDNTYKSSSGLFFITTFTSSVWLAIAGLLVVWTFLKMLDNRFVPPDDSFEPLPNSAPWYSRQRHFVLKSNIPRRLRKSLQSTANRMIGNTEDDTANLYPSTRQWILNFTILLSGIFLALAYEASMTAGLVQETMESDFQSVQDFKSCRIAADDVCLPKGDAVQSYWESSILPLPCNKGRMPNLIDSYDETIEKTANKECKFSVIDGATARFATAGKYCRRLVMTGEPTNPGGGAFILPRDSEYTEYLTNVTLQLRENGSLETLDEFFDRWGSCSIQTSTTLTMDRLRYFFVAAYGSSFLIFLIMILDPQRPPTLEPSTHTATPTTEDPLYSDDLK